MQRKWLWHTGNKPMDELSLGKKYHEKVCDSTVKIEKYLVHKKIVHMQLRARRDSY